MRGYIKIPVSELFDEVDEDDMLEYLTGRPKLLKQLMAGLSDGDIEAEASRRSMLAEDHVRAMSDDLRIAFASHDAQHFEVLLSRIEQ